MKPHNEAFIALQQADIITIEQPVDLLADQCNVVSRWKKALTEIRSIGVIIQLIQVNLILAHLLLKLRLFN